MRHLLVIAALLAPLAARAELPPPGPWTHGHSQRIHIDVGVQLPRFVWFVADFNRQARVSSFHLGLVVTCTPSEGKSGRFEVACHIDDAALQAAPMPSEVGRLDPVLTELDAKLTGATVVLQVRPDGRISGLDLRDAFVQKRKNRRIRAMNENLRLVVQRAFAGLDVARGKRPLTVGEGWDQRTSMLTMAPTTVGTVSSTDLRYKVASETDDAWVVDAAGKAMVAPANGTGELTDFFDTRILGEIRLDKADGRLLSHKWTAMGLPTPSSALAEGTAGLPYTQQGVMRQLGPDEAVGLGETGELPPDRRTVLQVDPNGTGPR